MINDSLRTYPSAFSVISYCSMLPNRQSRRHSLCIVMSHVVLFAYPIKLHTSARIGVTKIHSAKEIIFKLSYLTKFGLIINRQRRHMRNKTRQDEAKCF